MIKLLLFILVPFFLFAQKPDLLLLKVYKDQNISGWVMSEKLDGVRAYWNGKELISRQGNVIHAPKYFTKNLPSFELDGELWTKRADFENISSIVRDRIPSDKWQSVMYNIFEVPHSEGNLTQRLAKAKKFEGKYLKVIKQLPVKNRAELQAFLKEVEQKGGEGVVVRDPNAEYIAKRTSKVLKVKSFLDTECEVIGYTKGKGKYKGKFGALKCQMDNGKVFKICSGFSDKERENPPDIGSRVTFKYKELTKNGMPRFPIFLRIREE
jgi:DNA ligase-1